MWQGIGQRPELRAGYPQVLTAPRQQQRLVSDAAEDGKFQGKLKVPPVIRVTDP